jgi:hypothetical protein
MVGSLFLGCVTRQHYFLVLRSTSAHSEHIYLQKLVFKLRRVCIQGNLVRNELERTLKWQYECNFQRTVKGWSVLYIHKEQNICEHIQMFACCKVCGHQRSRQSSCGLACLAPIQSTHAQVRIRHGEAVGFVTVGTLIYLVRMRTNHIESRESACRSESASHTSKLCSCMHVWHFGSR